MQAANVGPDEVRSMPDSHPLVVRGLRVLIVWMFLAACAGTLAGRHVLFKAPGRAVPVALRVMVTVRAGVATPSESAPTSTVTSPGPRGVRRSAVLAPQRLNAAQSPDLGGVGIAA